MLFIKGHGGLQAAVAADAGHNRAESSAKWQKRQSMTFVRARWMHKVARLTGTDRRHATTATTTGFCASFAAIINAGIERVTGRTGTERLLLVGACGRVKRAAATLRRVVTDGKLIPAATEWVVAWRGVCRGGVSVKAVTARGGGWGCGRIIQVT